MPFDASAEDARIMNDWFAANSGLMRLYRPSVDDCRAALDRLGDHPPAHLDLAGALLDEDKLDAAAQHAEQALTFGHPTPGVVHNVLACVFHRRGDVEKMKDQLVQAGRIDPQHPVLLRNAQAARTWLGRGPRASATALMLDPSHDFQLLERTMQPTLPGPLSADTRSW